MNYQVKNFIIRTLRFLPDRTYLKLVYFAKMHKRLNLDNPQTFNEKLQWLKLYDRKPEYTRMVDKYEAKKYVADIIGDEYIIPTYGVWDRFEDIDFDTLPNQFVLKCTHDSGGIVICKDKSQFDKEAARKIINRSMKNNFYYYGREWPYKNVKPRIIAEKFMVDESGYELKDYKFFSFDGFARAMFIASDRQVEGEDTKFDFFNMDFVHLPFTNGHPNANHEIKRPESFEKMRSLAEKLSEGIPQVRVDFYDIDGHVYFGELTFAHWSGFVPFEPESWDEKFGEWIKLPDSIGGGYLIASKGYILYIHDDTELNTSLIDYKLFCFNGKPRMTLVCTERFSKDGIKEDFYDEDWEHLDIKRPSHGNSSTLAGRPKHYDKMKELATNLSENSSFSRIDFYEVNDNIYFGEITFYPMSGFEGFDTSEQDLFLGNMLKLPGGGIS